MRGSAFPWAGQVASCCSIQKLCRVERQMTTQVNDVHMTDHNDAAGTFAEAGIVRVVTIVLCEWAYMVRPVERRAAMVRGCPKGGYRG